MRNMIEKLQNKLTDFIYKLAEAVEVKVLAKTIEIESNKIDNK